ncbi:hypothetical protein GUITHDRAFT_151910, partial [Guillardia theta CCMP2712]
MDKVWDAVDNILIPEPLPEEEEFAGSSTKYTEDSSDSNGPMTFCTSVLSSIRPAKAVADSCKVPILKDVWTWTVEKTLGNAKVGALYTSEKSWAVGGGYTFPGNELEVKGRVSNDWPLSKLHATSSISTKLADNVRLNLCSDVDLGAGSLDKILASRQFGIRLRIKNDQSVSTEQKQKPEMSKDVPVLSPPKPPKEEEKKDASGRQKKVEDRQDWAKFSWKELNPMQHIMKLTPSAP